MPSPPLPTPTCRVFLGGPCSWVFRRTHSRLLGSSAGGQGWEGRGRVSGTWSLSLTPQSSQPTLETFQDLLHRHPDAFYLTRTAKALQAHWQLMKQYYLLEDQTGSPPGAGQGRGLQVMPPSPCGARRHSRQPKKPAVLGAEPSPGVITHLFLLGVSHLAVNSTCIFSMGDVPAVVHTTDPSLSFPPWLISPVSRSSCPHGALPASLSHLTSARLCRAQP